MATILVLAVMTPLMMVISTRTMAVVITLVLDYFNQTITKRLEQRIHRERALYLRSRRLRRTPLASWKRPCGISPSHVSLFLWYLMHPRKVRRRMWTLNRVASNLLCAGLRRQDCLPWCPRAYTPPPVHDTPAFSCIPSSRSTILSMLVS